MLLVSVVMSHSFTSLDIQEITCVLDSGNTELSKSPLCCLGSHIPDKVTVTSLSEQMLTFVKGTTGELLEGAEGTTEEGPPCVHLTTTFSWPVAQSLLHSRYVTKSFLGKVSWMGEPGNLSLER